MVKFILSKAKLCELGSMLSYFLHLTNRLNSYYFHLSDGGEFHLTLISVFIWELSFILLFVKMMYRSKLILNRKFSYLKNLHLFSYVYWFKLHLPVACIVFGSHYSFVYDHSGSDADCWIWNHTVNNLS